MRSRTSLPVQQKARAALLVEPFLHVDSHRVYNPITHLELLPGDRDWPVVRRLVDGAGELAGLNEVELRELREAGWLIDGEGDPMRRYRLRFVSLETHTICNQKCYFCPVAFAPRESYFMATEEFERIVDELGGYRETIEGVFLINYNEPTVDRRFVDQCRKVIESELPLAVNTNGTGLTPERVDELLEIGRLRFLQINLSTIDGEQYRATRGVDHLEIVLRNLDYARRFQIAQEMAIVVLGEHDEIHDRNFAAIQDRFPDGTFEVRRFDIMDRAGNLDVGQKPETRGDHLRGCENLGSRPLQHLHITPRGECLLCCEDYHEKWKVGDLRRQSVHEILTSDRIAEIREWVYGLGEGPEDFLCRDCIYART